MDELFVLILVLLVVAVLLSAIVLPIVAVVISSSSRRRLSQLEARLHRLETMLAPASAPEVETPKTAPEPPPTTPPHTPTPETPSHRTERIESIIGRRWVGWIAVALILFATAFFLKYAFENRWIGEVGRVATGITFGIAMALAGARYQQRGWRLFSQILTSGGIILLYLSTYAAFAYYTLVSQKTAFVFLAILIAETAFLALKYNAAPLAMMALIGGFLTPLLLRSNQDQYRSFFTYIVALDIGALALLKHWRGLSSVAYFGTQLLFWLWYDQNYQPEKRTAVLIFQTAIFLIFLLAHLGRELIRRELATIEDALLALVNPFVFFATAHHLLNLTHHDWMGAFAIVMALMYAGAAKLLHSQAASSRREILLLVAVAITFVAVAIPIQLRANWITIAWAVEALAILWAGLRVSSLRLRAHAYSLFALAFFKLILWDSPYGLRPAFTPVFNRYFLSSMVVIACFLDAIYLCKRAIDKRQFEGRALRLVISLAAAVAFWFVISTETHTYFTGRALAETDLAAAAHQRWLGQMAVSVVWAAYAGALAAAGFLLRSAAIRWGSLALFALTVIKAMLIDIAALEQFYRIIVFFVLGVLLLLVAWAYHRVFYAQTR
jgi:uncharacterized membrane protein